MYTSMFITTAPRNLDWSVPNLACAKWNWIASYHLSFKNFLWDRIGRKNYGQCWEKRKRNPPNPQPLLFLNLKIKSAPFKRNSSDFLTAIWNKTLSAKPTEKKKQNWWAKRSRWRSNRRGLNKSGYRLGGFGFFFFQHCPQFRRPIRSQRKFLNEWW